VGNGAHGIGLSHPTRIVVLDEFQLATKKVELPVFDGVDPRGWIRRAKAYFDHRRIFEGNKLKLARLSMEGSSFLWFQT
jgi:hypothetical protein